MMMVVVSKDVIRRRTEEKVQINVKLDHGCIPHVRRALEKARTKTNADAGRCW
jgi:hypothetical protein